MFHNLPESIQQQIIVYLEADNFCAARDLRDAFVKKQKDQMHLIVASQKMAEMSVRDERM